MEEDIWLSVDSRQGHLLVSLSGPRVWRDCFRQSFLKVEHMEVSQNPQP